MASIGTLKLKGKSGKTYSFDVYKSSVTFNENIACVYYISKRTEKSDGTGNHSKIYIGETDDIKARLANHHKQSCFDRHNYNAVSISKISTQAARTQAESDLIAALDPPCNG